MNKFFDYLSTELPLGRIRELLAYIRRFAAALGGEIPVEGHMGKVGFCASSLPGEQVQDARQESWRDDQLSFLKISSEDHRKSSFPELREGAGKHRRAQSSTAASP